MLGGLPLSRMTYALVVGAAGLLWSTLYVVAMWEGIRSTFTRATVATAERPRTVARRSREDRVDAWDDDGGRIVDERALYLQLSPESKVRHAAFR
jgi:hypothetical protein